MYSYNATVLKVVDGDTLWLRIDLGMDVQIRISTRLNGINAPEMSTPEGRDAYEFVDDLIPAGSIVHVETIKDRKEKYGRYLVEVFTVPDMSSVNAMIVEAGHAVAYNP